MINGLFALAAVLSALLIGMAWGVFMQANTVKRATAKRRTHEDSHTDCNRTVAKPTQKWLTASKLIVLGVLLVDASSTYFVLYLCWLSITRQFTGSLPYLTALIGAMQAATGYVLGHYFKKSTAENTVGGITYDAALGKSTFDTV